MYMCPAGHMVMKPENANRSDCPYCKRKERLKKMQSERAARNKTNDSENVTADIILSRKELDCLASMLQNAYEKTPRDDADLTSFLGGLYRKIACSRDRLIRR